MATLPTPWRLPALIALLVVLGTAAVMLMLRPSSTPTGTAKTERSYRIGYQEIALYRHVFVAQEKGYFRQAGVQVELVPFTSANQMMIALLAGQIDVAGLTNLEVALKVESEEPDRFEIVNFLVWTQEAYPDYILDCTPGQRLQRLSQLEGRHLGRHPGTAVAGFANAVLQRAGVDPERVRQTELQPNLMGDAVRSGSVDALYAMDPAATRLVQAGSCDVLLSNPLGTVVQSPIPISGTALSRNLLTSDPAAAGAITRALDAAIAFTRRPGTERQVAQIISRYTRINADEALAMNPSRYWTTNEIDPVRVQAVADQFRALGISSAPVSSRSMMLLPPRGN